LSVRTLTTVIPRYRSPLPILAANIPFTSVISLIAENHISLDASSMIPRAYHGTMGVISAARE
jgi:hypothetical protein